MLLNITFLYNGNKVGRLNFDGNHVSALVSDDKQYKVDIEIVDNKVVNLIINVHVKKACRR